MSGGRALLVVLTWAFKLTFTAVAVAIPVLGGWAASSLAAASGGPIWAAILAAVAAFPLLPLLWEGVGRLRTQGRERILTTWDRLVLRTLAINVLFVGGLLLFGPGTLFGALSTRGDWMLDGREGEGAERARSTLFAIADHMEWLFEASYENEFADLVDDDAAETDDEELEVGDVDDRTEAPDDRGSNEASNDGSNEAPAGDGAIPAWPLPIELASGVREVPAHLETFADIAYFLRRSEPSSWRQVKAIHDFVADRVAYDAVALADDTIGPQDAQTVLREGVGVCAGYANLFQALAEAAGFESVVVVGDTRDESGAIAGGNGHAWNAVKIDGGWYLVDATWNAGSVSGRTFTKRYTTDYLFTPPAIFGETHRPLEDRWQLRETPLSRGEFARQPMLRPAFYRHGFRLRSPRRARTEVSGALEVIIDNPEGHYMSATWSRGGNEGRCDTSRGTNPLRIECALPSPGVHQVTFFGNTEAHGTYWSVGGLEVVRR